MPIQNAVLRILGIESHGTFYSFTTWYKQQQEEAEYYKKHGISPIQEDYDEYLGSHMWLARFLEARKLHDHLLKEFEAGKIRGHIGSFLDDRDNKLKECPYVSIKELRRYFQDRTRLPVFLLPPEYEEHELAAENKKLKEKIQKLEADLKHERAYLDESSPWFLKEVAVLIETYKHFMTRRQNYKPSAIAEMERWIRKTFKHYNLTGTAIRRITQVLNWDRKPDKK